jgi:hypothetical protein
MTGIISAAMVVTIVERRGKEECYTARESGVGYCDPER